MASAVAHQTICWPQVYKRKPKIYCVVCGQYTKPSRQGKKLYKCVEQDCKNRIHAECNAGNSFFDCTLANLALLRKQEGSVKEKVTFEPEEPDLHIAKMDIMKHIETTECERLKPQENNNCDVPFEREDDVINQKVIEENYENGLKIDINNNKLSENTHQHRKEHKRKSLLTNDKTSVDDLSLIESHKPNKKAKSDTKDSEMTSIKHRKEHKRKTFSVLQNATYPIIHKEIHENAENSTTKYSEIEVLYNKAKIICDLFIIQLHHDQQSDYLGEVCEYPDTEILEVDYDEPYVEGLEQIYFKGHDTDRNRKKYVRKWRKHKKKRKRTCKKVSHFPLVTQKMEDNKDEQYTEDVIVGTSTNTEQDQHCNARYADIYNELYDDEDVNRPNKPTEDENFLYLVRQNNERNLQPFELPHITYIIDKTDPDEYQPPDYYFD